MEKQVCNWCHPTEDGDFNMYQFIHPQDTERKAKASVYGGKFAVTIDEPGDYDGQRLSFPIRYCPFCGEPFNGAEAEGNV